MGVIDRALKAAWYELTKPASYVKGDEFERFIRNILFPGAHYELLYKTYDYSTSRAFSIESSREPDFRFRTIKSGLEFFIEAKYRSRFYYGKIEWCKPYQLRRYQVINKEIPIFIVIGVEGKPTAPEQVYLLPLRHIKYTVLFRSFLRKYEVPGDRSISDIDLLDITEAGNNGRDGEAGR